MAALRLARKQLHEHRQSPSSSFLLGLLDVGNTLRVVVTAANVAGSTPASSAVTGLIAGL